MTDTKLPPLPPRVPVDKHLPTGVVIYGYTNDMMCDYARDYARANVAAKDAEIEALRAEVETWKNFARGNKELLQESVYRAEQLAEALRELKDLMLGQVKWEPCDCGCLQQRVPDGPHSVTWLRAAQQVELAIRKAQENDDEPTLD